jgi:Methyltransferase FkbM domain
MDGASAALCAENLAPLRDRATVVGAAIAASDGSVAYSTTGDPGHHAIDPDGEGEAAAITLDTLFEHVAAGRIVDYVKMNIEGSEEAVLGAGGNWPASVRSITVVAHGSYGADGAREDLRALGFTVAGGDSGVAYGARAEPRPVGSGRRLRARAHR